MTTEKAPDQVTVLELTKWMERILSRDIVHPSGSGGFIGRAAGDFRQVEQIGEPELLMGVVGSFQIETSDGRVFAVAVNEERDRP